MTTPRTIQRNLVLYLPIGLAIFGVMAVAELLNLRRKNR